MVDGKHQAARSINTMPHGGGRIDNINKVSNTGHVGAVVSKSLAMQISPGSQMNHIVRTKVPNLGEEIMVVSDIAVMIEASMEWIAWRRGREIEDGTPLICQPINDIGSDKSRSTSNQKAKAHKELGVGQKKHSL